MLRITISGKTTSELQEQITDLYKTVVVEKEISYSADTSVYVATAKAPETVPVSQAPEANLPTVPEPKQTVMELGLIPPTGTASQSAALTKEDVVAALTKLIQKKGMPQALEVLKTMGGVDKVSQLTTNHYRPVFTRCEELLAD